MSRIMTDLHDAVASIKEHHAGKITLRTSTVRKASPIVMTGSHVRRIRDRFHISQEVFARCLNTSKRMMEMWEQGFAKPTGTAVALLMLVERRPDVLQELAAAFRLNVPNRLTLVAMKDARVNRVYKARNAVAPFKALDR